MIPLAAPVAIATPAVGQRCHQAAITAGSVVASCRPCAVSGTLRPGLVVSTCQPRAAEASAAISSARSLCGARVAGPRRIRHLHHMRHWIAGGTTNASNLVGTCWFHHHLLHEGGWNATGNGDDEVVFAGPNGHSIRSRAGPVAA